MKKGLTLKKAMQRAILPRMTQQDQVVGNALVMAMLDMPEVEIPVDHFLWAGCYARTCFVKAGEVIAGALIKIPTIVIVQGVCKVVVGSDVELIEGYKVLRGMDGRRQFFSALEDTYITMLFATNAKNVEEAEKEFTD